MAIRFKDPFVRLRLFEAALVLLNNSEQVQRSTKVGHINLDNVWMFYFSLWARRALFTYNSDSVVQFPRI